MVGAEGGDRGLDAYCGAEIVRFIKTQYGVETRTYIERYKSFYLEFDGPISGSPVLPQVYDGVENAMEHLRRASYAKDRAGVDGEIKMATWHLDVVHMPMLLELAYYVQMKVERLVATGTYDRGIRENCDILALQLHEMTQGVLEWSNRAAQIKNREVPVPELSDMQDTKKVVNIQKSLLYSYVRLWKDLTPP